LGIRLVEARLEEPDESPQLLHRDPWMELYEIRPEGILDNENSFLKADDSYDWLSHRIKYECINNALDWVTE
jgi:hypothetical protein